MNFFLDIAPSICAFIVALYALPSIKEGIKPKHYLVGGILIIIMGFSIYQASENSEITGNLSSNMKELLDQRRADSVSNAYFQTYLKDSVGISREGNKARIVNQNIYNSYSQVKESPLNPPLVLPTISPVNITNILPDSINYNFRVSKDSLYISPKEGAWVRPFFATDISNKSKNLNIVEEGMGPMEPADKMNVNDKIFNVGMYLIYERAVYPKKPIALNLSGNRNQYIIFGEQGSSTKRYIYRRGKVEWIPEK